MLIWIIKEIVPRLYFLHDLLSFIIEVRQIRENTNFIRKDFFFSVILALDQFFFARMFVRLKYLRHSYCDIIVFAPEEYSFVFLSMYSKRTPITCVFAFEICQFSNAVSYLTV